MLWQMQRGVRGLAVCVSVEEGLGRRSLRAAVSLWVEKN
jgi:hypothetical protein